MKVGEFTKMYKVRGHYAMDRKVLQENMESDLVAYAFARGAYDSSNFYWVSKPLLTLMVFRSARKLRGYVNGVETNAVHVLEAIKGFEAGSQMTAEAERELLMGVL